MNAPVVGFDIGFDTCYIAVARGGGIETIANDYSDRATPTCISFGRASRFIGTSAKQLMITNLSNSVSGFTRLIGKSYSDVSIQDDLKRLSCEYTLLDNDRIGLIVEYMNTKSTFTPEQLLAMQMTKLKELTEAQLNMKVIHVVINVHNFLTNRERQAYLDAAHMAQLNCVRLLNDTTAAGISYGMYNRDLPALDASPRNVVLVDMGASSLKATFFQFNAGKLKAVTSSYDAHLGGRNFDDILFKHFAVDFRKRYKIDVLQSKKASLRLLQECEKLKKLMSTNASAIPLSIECFMDDKDVTGRISRSEFEQMAHDLFVRVEAVFRDLLVQANVTTDDIHVVEIVGGSTRIPAVKELARKVYNKELSMTLNCDEAVSRGCAFQSAILSPAFRVREFNISDANCLAISVSYDEHDEPMEVFGRDHSFPFSRALTLHKNAPFELLAEYTDARVPNDLRALGRFVVNSVNSPNGDLVRIKVKVRLNIHGIFTVSQAQQIDLVEKSVPVEPTANAESNDTEAVTAENSQTPSDGGKMDVDTSAEAANTKAPSVAEKIGAKLKATELPIVPHIPYVIDTSTLNSCCEIEGQMIMQDKLERERSLAKNNVEEYVYDAREKLNGDWEGFCTDAERDAFSQLLNVTEDWLYDEGDNLPKQPYIDRLQQLKSQGDRIAYRAWESLHRVASADALGMLCKHIGDALMSYRNGEEQYNHIDAKDMQNLYNEMEKVQSWYTQEAVAQQKLKKSDDPTLTVAMLDSRRQALDNLAGSVLNKPKPKVVPPPAEDAHAPEGDGTAVPDGVPPPNGLSQGNTEVNDMAID